MPGLLKARLAEQFPQQRAVIKGLLTKSGNQKLGEYTIEQVYGGMRGIAASVCDTSLVDENTGLWIRGKHILELVDQTPEQIFYLMLTGEKPTAEQLADLKADLAARAEVPAYVWSVLDAMPEGSHPMSMLSAALMAMQSDSVTAKTYASTSKDKLWEGYYEDGLKIVATVNAVAAAIYRKRYGKGARIAAQGKGFGPDFASMLGLPDEKGTLAKLLDLYLTLHCDHESGNVSTATALTVASAHSDLYLSIAAGLNGLAGPLHGLANQNSLAWTLSIRDRFGGVPTNDQIKDFAWEILNSGKVLPGFGHAVLRDIDPRFTAFRDFAKAEMPDAELYRIVEGLFQVVPKVLLEHGKAKNPWPNVDAISGCLLYNFGLTEFDFYTVLFGVSRVLGFTAQIVLNRGTGMPIMRPTRS